MYDYVLKGATIIDPANSVHSVCDLAIEQGKIAEIENSISSGKARRFIDLTGSIVIPGIIDSHVHLYNKAWGAAAYRMLAASGVVTAVDFSGPLTEITKDIPRAGCGLNVGVLEALIPGKGISNNAPGADEIKDFTHTRISNGALGIKIMGGHFPLTPDSTSFAIKIANEMGAYAAFHAGTTENGSDLNGFKEAVSLIDGKHAHLAHINSYCRGEVDRPLAEANEALTILSENMNIISESYLGLVNGTSGYCNDKVPESLITRKYLIRGGFAPNQEGMGNAIKTGYAQVNALQREENVLLSGKEGFEAWEKDETNMIVSFKVNDPDVLRVCATAKNQEGDFIVNAISTDGGGIVRNVQIEKGLLLVDLGLLSFKEFVLKTSFNPSRMFGMFNKGHLGVGADADITVLDYKNRKPVLTMAGGNIILLKNIIIGTGGTLLISEKGKKRVDESGIDRQIIDVTAGLLYKREKLKEDNK